ncbi:MAG: hypothetical protein HQL90_14620 [Magnetococcales bacterium]|nr:hypothetical protein [Magnetococcales bacterium]
MDSSSAIRWRSWLSGLILGPMIELAELVLFGLIWLAVAPTDRALVVCRVVVVLVCWELVALVCRAVGALVCRAVDALAGRVVDALAGRAEVAPVEWAGVALAGLSMTAPVK